MKLFDIVSIGAFIGAAICVVWLGFDIFSHRYKSKYDERQVVIHGKIALHTLIFAAILAVISSMLYLILDSYMSLYTQNLLIILLAAGFYSVEQAFRGILFPVNWTVRKFWLMVFLWIMYVVMAVLNTIDATSKGYVILDKDGNPDLGALNLALWYTVIFSSLIIICWRFQGNKRQKK